MYHLFPYSLQNAIISAYGLVLQRRYYGNGFTQWCDTYDSQEFWTQSQIQQYQREKLQHLIELAVRHVPYYRKAFANIDCTKLKSLDDLKRLPILEKAVIRQDAMQLLDERLNPHSLYQDRTSGSTGTPLVIYWPKSMFPKWWSLAERRVRAWAGVRQSMPRAMIGGRTIVKGDSKSPYWRYNYLWKQLYMSSYHISDSTAPDYINAITRYGSQWITGYGSAISLLGEWLCKNSIKFQEIRAVLTSGDNLLPGHRRAIQEGFCCKVFDNYGSAEGCLFISECEHGRMHVQPETGILEILDENGNQCKPGEIGHMIVTGLLNDAMPLIRYRTGDLAAWSHETACPCGRNSLLVSHIEGRADDYLLHEDGRRIGRLSTAIKKALTIHSAQIVQDRLDHAWLLIHPADGYHESHGEIIRNDILSRIGIFKIDVCIVNTVPKTPVGKQSLVVRLVDSPILKDLYQTTLPEIPWKY
ncbi:MAG: phenylacetate--CoA ligase family protein [Candidatus Kuenenia sp.]|nr:phenylacetate--CoA ligase family protein [Candidatus Kuenenia hertensis]